MANGIVSPGTNRREDWVKIAADNRDRAKEVRPLGNALAAKIAADCEAFARLAIETADHYGEYDYASQA